MKWLFALVLGGVALGLVVSFPRAQEDTAAPESAADIPKGEEPKPVAGDARPDAEKPATLVKALRSDDGIPERPAAATTDVEKPASADEPTKSGSSDAKAATGRDRSQILHGRIVPLKHVRAELARQILAKEFQHEFTKSMQLEVIPGHNSLLLTVPLAMYPPILEVVRKLDQPATGAAETGDPSGAEVTDRASVSENGDGRTDTPASDNEELKIFKLRSADATASRELLLELYPAEFKDRSKIAADARTNSLIARAPRELMNVIEAVVLNLDGDETAKRPERTPAGVAQSKSGDTRGLPRTLASGAREDWLESLTMAANPDGEVRRVNEELRRQEQQAAELARQYRQGQGAASPDGPALLKLKAELETAVQAAFDARQKVQLYGLDQLRQRLAVIENRLAMRERVEPEIIKQRVEQLLHPERDWEPAGETGRSPADADNGSADRAKDVAHEVDNAVRRATDFASSAAGEAARRSPAQNSISPESVWMTDFNKAREMARKLNRPLVVHFYIGMVEPAHQMYEVLYAPTVLRLLHRRFVAVRIDVQVAENERRQRQYEAGRIALPSDVILGSDGEVLGKSEGLQTTDAFLIMLQDARDKFVLDVSSNREPGSGNVSLKPAAALSPVGLADPRKGVLDAESAIIAARSAVAAAEKSCKSARSDLSRMQDAYKKGAIAEKTMREAERQVETCEAQLEKSKLELQLAERQAKLARENLDSQIKLLELDMDDAKLRIAHLAEEEARARRLLENKAMSKAEYDEKKLALEQARVPLSRLRELMDLYSKSIPGEESRAPGDVNQESPESRSKKEGEVRAVPAELSLGNFSFSNGTARPGVNIHVDFKLAAVTSTEQASNLETQINVHSARIRQAVNKIVRSSNLEELNDPSLGTIKRLIREEINRLLRTNYVNDVVISEFRSIEQ